MAEKVEGKAQVPNFRYQELDALRGMAALMVVLFHYTMRRPESELGFKFGTTGVDLFFIISGFVIFMSINKVKTGRDFVINRASRLYPTYWACVTICFGVYTFFDIYFKRELLPNVVRYLGNMTMFQHYLGIRDLEPPYWTMIIEMIFYIGILILFKSRLLRFLDFFGVILCLAVIAATAFFYQHLLVRQILYWIPLLQFIPLFFAGTLFYKIHHGGQLLKNYVLLLMCLISQCMMFGYAGRSSGFISKNEYAIVLCVYFLLFVLFIHGKLRFIISRPAMFLGKISFALYLIHQGLSLNIIIPGLMHKLHFGFWPAAAVSLLVVIVLSAFVTWYVEIPLGKRMKSFLRSKFLEPSPAVKTF